jgi:isocitrate/isopropylmalate dehydrogenase
MLLPLKMNDVADRVMAVIRQTLSDAISTLDVGGGASTTECTEAVAARLEF